MAGQALGLNVNAAGLGVVGANTVLQPGDRVLDLGGGEPVAEVEAEADEDFVGTEMHGAGVIQPHHAGLAAGDSFDAFAGRGVGRLAGQQALALEGEEGSGNPQD
jgi:hypothetical protein